MRLNNWNGRTDSANSHFLVLNKKIFKTVDKVEKPMNKFGNSIKISRKAPFNLILYTVVAATSPIISFFNPVTAVLFEKILMTGTICSYILFRITIGLVSKLHPEKSNAIPADTKLNLIVQAIVKKSNITIPITVLISNSTEMNAFAVSFYKADNCTTSGAAVIINKGLIDSVTEEELGSIIAHERGHILHRDSAHGLRLLSLQCGFGSCVFSGMLLLIDAYHKNEAIKLFLGTLKETPFWKIPIWIFNLRIRQSQASGLFPKGVLLVSFGSVLIFIGKFKRNFSHSDHNYLESYLLLT
jgi:Zn-dependent protease with chaperone function